MQCKKQIDHSQDKPVILAKHCKNVRQSENKNGR